MALSSPSTNLSTKTVETYSHLLSGTSLPTTPLPRIHTHMQER